MVGVVAGSFSGILHVLDCFFARFSLTSNVKACKRLFFVIYVVKLTR